MAGDLIDLTQDLSRALQASKMKEGQMSVFVVGSTAAIAAFEYEAGLIRDMREFYERVAASGKPYHLTEAHLRLGTWQQVVLAEFDHRPRKREIVVQMIGETSGG